MQITDTPPGMPRVSDDYRKRTGPTWKYDDLKKYKESLSDFVRCFFFGWYHNNGYHTKEGKTITGAHIDFASNMEIARSVIEIMNKDYRTKCTIRTYFNPDEFLYDAMFENNSAKTSRAEHNDLATAILLAASKYVLTT